MCAHGPTGQAASGTAVRTIQGTRRGFSSREKTCLQKIFLIFVEKVRRLDAMITAQVFNSQIRF